MPLILAGKHTGGCHTTQSPATTGETQPSADISNHGKTARTLITILSKTARFQNAVILGCDPNTVLNQSHCQYENNLQTLIKTNFIEVSVSALCWTQFSKTLKSLHIYTFYR